MGCEGCVRVILLIFNLIFFLVGAAALGVGIWVVVDGTIFLELLGKIPDGGSYGSLISQAAYILIAAGAVIFLIAFFGCCGAWKKNKCLLVTYAVVIGILLAMQIATLVAAYFFYDQIIVIVNQNLAKALEGYDSKFVDESGGKFKYNAGSIISKGIDAIQIEFTCCGVNNYTDYKNHTFDFPPTCCPSDLKDAPLKEQIDTIWKGSATTYTTSAPTCPGNSTYASSIVGCTDKINSYVKEKSVIFMGIAGGALGIQLMLIIISCCLVCAIRSEENKA